MPKESKQVRLDVHEWIHEWIRKSTHYYFLECTPHQKCVENNIGWSQTLELSCPQTLYLLYEKPLGNLLWYVSLHCIATWRAAVCLEWSGFLLALFLFHFDVFHWFDVWENVIGVIERGHKDFISHCYGMLGIILGSNGSYDQRCTSTMNIESN